MRNKVIRLGENKMTKFQEIKESRDLWRVFAITFISFYIILSFYVIIDTKRDTNVLRTYEINKEEWAYYEEWVDENGYVRANVTSGVHKYLGKEIEDICECFEEVCPSGSRWLDGSKVCFGSNQKVVEGIGCISYICADFIIKIEDYLEEEKTK